MKKPIILLILLATMASASAQVSSETETIQTAPTSLSGWSFGVQALYSINVLEADVAYQENVRYVAGDGLGFSLNATYNVQPWLAFRGAIEAMPKNYVRYGAYDATTNVAGLMTQAKNMYLNIPVVADFSIGGKLRFHARLGGYMGYWLTGRRQGISIPLTSVDPISEFDVPYEFDSRRDNRFDAGITSALAFSALCFNRIDLELALRLDYSLTDVQKQYTKYIHPRYNTTVLLTLGAAYKF